MEKDEIHKIIYEKDDETNWEIHFIDSKTEANGIYILNVFYQDSAVLVDRKHLEIEKENIEQFILNYDYGLRC